VNLKNNTHPLGFFSPLDLATILYVALSGIYICFGKADFHEMLPHFLMRLGVLLTFYSLALLSKRRPADRLVIFIRSLYPLIFISYFYTETCFMKNIIISSDLDPYFFAAEEKLWGSQPSLDFSRIMNGEWFNELMNLCYFSYYLVIIIPCFALFFQKREQSHKAIFTVVFSFYLYYTIFAVFPVSGPHYYMQGQGQESAPLHFFGTLMRWIISDLEQPTGAFPSSHVGIAVIIAWISYHHLRRLFFMILPFVIGICFATVYIKAHYVVDVIGGLITAPLFILFSGKVYNKFLSFGPDKMLEKSA
jgi:membrane-associated phospholipid phosphatase